MNQFLGVAVESVVAGLLIMTLGYCIVLNKRLKRLKADESSLKATIGELITATESAERAIGGLKLTVHDCNENLAAQLSTAAEVTERLNTQINLGNDVVLRVSRIAQAGRNAVAAEVVEPAQPKVATAPAPKAEAPRPRLSSAKAIAAAAQAFTERKRVGGLAA